MSREVHVRIWEGAGVRLPRATRRLLLDGQLGRQVSWAAYWRMGCTQFQLLRTN
jgi:hypothetical protein